MTFFIGIVLIGAAVYFAHRFFVSWMYEALQREHIRREVEKEVKTRNDVMFFEYDEVWNDKEEKEAV